MTDNYIYTNGVLILPTPNQPQQPGKDTAKPTPPDAKLTADTAKTRIQLHLDNDILKTLSDRAELTGKDYETLINDTLRHSLSPDSGPLTIEILRQVLQ